MRAEERIAQLERELAEQQAKSVLLETALAEQRAEVASARQRTSGGASDVSEVPADEPGALSG